MMEESVARSEADYRRVEAECEANKEKMNQDLKNFEKIHSDRLLHQLFLHY